jgi:glycosyltransferase involved in cell wall biosynthesis
MKVHLVDPPAYTPPYDHALAGALARAGVEVELVTSRFAHGEVPRGEGYSVDERFYRRASAAGLGDRRRRLLRGIEHLPDMVRYRRAAVASADVVHYQWLPLPRLDRHLLAPLHPRLFTMHWRLPDSGSRIATTLRRLLARMDAVIVHSEHGARRLAREFAVAEQAIEVIPHGAFDYLTRQSRELPLPAELGEVEGPVILAFGLVRPYKGTEVLLEAFARLEGAELWVVGRPMMAMRELREAAARAPGRVRFVEEFVPEAQIPAYMRRADLVVLPYRNIEQSGVLYTALAFGRPLVLSKVGGFGEIGALGAARLVPPGDSGALAEALGQLLADPAERRRLGEAALAACSGPYSWDRIGERTAALYRRLLG